MICTPEQAKSKWCPFGRFVLGPQGRSLTNRAELTSASDALNCIATDCMAWRWAQHDAEAELGCCGLAHGDRISLRETC